MTVTTVRTIWFSILQLCSISYIPGHRIDFAQLGEKWLSLTTFYVAQDIAYLPVGRLVVVILCIDIQAPEFIDSDRVYWFQVGKVISQAAQ